MMIDISKGYRQYSPTELRDYAYKNLLAAGTTELGDFLEYIFTGYKPEIDKDEVEKYQEQGYDSGYSDGYSAAKNAAISAVENI